jgi:hypothetical protein
MTRNLVRLPLATAATIRSLQDSTQYHPEGPPPD